MDSLLNIVTDGTRYPDIFTFYGTLAVALFFLIQIARTWIKKKLLSELMSPIWAPIVMVVFIGCLMGIDHLRANGFA